LCCALWNRNESERKHFFIQGETKKKGTFEKPNKNLRNPTKKNVLTEIEPLQLAF
jgi:hypothetical protein